jgi:flagellar biosynthesis/type III secretory pathway protein FliH
MSCLSAERRAELEEQRDQLEAIITELNTAIIAGAKSAHMTSYELDTGAGKQKVTYKNINELHRAIKGFQNSLDRVNSMLDGTSVVDFQLRRKAGLRTYGTY